MKYLNKIFVTGGCGFIGSNFIKYQLLNNNTILNFDNLSYSANSVNLKSVENNNNYTFIKGDICDFKSVDNAINLFKPDFIVHFAAESHVDRSIDNPIPFINTNVLGTANLLESATNYWNINNQKFSKFLHISTDEVFGSINDGKFNETTKYDPQSPYSASKASSDHLVRAWHSTYGLPIIISNCSNNYGPFQFPEKLIPLIIANCVDEKKLPVYGKGLNIRDWIYVDDHCEALHTLLFSSSNGQTYTIGGSSELSNIYIVNKICSILDELKPRKSSLPYRDLITYVKDRPGHDFRYAIDSSKIFKETGWKAKENFETGILKTIKWYLDNKKWWKDIQQNKYQQQRLGNRF